MKILKFLFVSLGLLLSTGAAAQAQCGRPIPQYTTYHSESGSYTQNGGFVFYSTASTSGYTSGMTGCAPGVLHTLNAKNLLTEAHSGRTVGGWRAGTPGCPSCQISASNTESTSVANGENWSEDDEWNGQCSIFGAFWGGVGVTFGIHIGINTFILESWDTHNCYYIQFCPNGNSAASCPAATFVDTDGMQAIPACNTLNYAIAYSLVVGGLCFPVGITIFSSVPAICQ